MDSLNWGDLPSSGTQTDAPQPLPHALAPSPAGEFSCARPAVASPAQTPPHTSTGTHTWHSELCHSEPGEPRSPLGDCSYLSPSCPNRSGPWGPPNLFLPEPRSPPASPFPGLQGVSQEHPALFCKNLNILAKPQEQHPVARARARGSPEPRSCWDSQQESIPTVSINQYNKRSHERVPLPARLPLSPRQHCRYIFLSWNL